MSNIGLVISERSRDIGDFKVGRLIPFRKKRSIGPFVFIDHMGPMLVGPHVFIDVDQHPHIGLCTLTYLFEGALHHKDSIGSDQLIEPGSVNLMVAGKGVSHTERTPQHLRNGSFVMHGYQIWIALPKELEEMDPEFHHIPAKELPDWKDGNTNFRLVAGEGFGKKAGVPTFSPLFMVDIATQESYDLKVDGELQGEIGICVVKGSISACDETIEAGNILVSNVEDSCQLTINANSHVVLFGGHPLENEVYMYWNFVSHSKEKLESAKMAWNDRTFPMMDNDDTYIPLPKTSI